MLTNNQKPCFVETTQGFSVSYKQKLLYSKYNPSKSIIQIIENLQILPNTIILAFSPVLNYGLSELCKKIPENCVIFACEFDPNLYEFEKENFPDEPNLILLSLQELYNLPIILNKNEYTFECNKKVEFAGNFKRVIGINFSLGVQFFAQEYEKLQDACVSAIMTFWANRATLTKFAKKYCANFFTNLKILPKTQPIKDFFNSINKSIIVCGAGESLEDCITFLKANNNRKDFYILCADTALKVLLDCNIQPDGVFVEEAQQIISKAFFRCQKNGIKIFAALSSIPLPFYPSYTENLIFYNTEFAQTTFIDQLENQNIIPLKNKPLGSVGLTTLYFATKFRQDSSIPIYIYGLDFSYSVGKTHCNGTMAHNQKLLATNKLCSIENYVSSFNNTSIKISNSQFTTPILKKYSEILYSFFNNEPNIFKSSNRQILIKLSFSLPKKYQNTSKKDLPIKKHSLYNNHEQINAFFEEEIHSLTLLKDILTGKVNLTENEQINKITELAKPRQYLYINFPDGSKFHYEISFLKRIRVQIDYYLKIFKPN